MAQVKNTGGGLGDEDPRRPPRLPADPKGKATKKLATKKRKFSDADTTRAAAVAEAVEHVERGDARSGVVIVVQQLPPATIEALEQVERRHGGPAGIVMVAGRRVVLDESQLQGEPQQEPQPAEQTQEGEQAEETERHLSHNFATLVVPVL